MMFIKLFQPDLKTQKIWLTSITSAILATLTSNSVSRASKLPPIATMDGLADGVSVYGESAQPDVVGKEYLVFEKVGNKTIGAFYLPRSEFSCFYGNFKGSELTITLIDGYDGKQYNSALAINSGRLTAKDSPMMGTLTGRRAESPWL